MDWITPEIAIGNYIDAQDGAVLRQFKSVLGLIPTLRHLRKRTMEAIAILREALAEEHRREIAEHEIEAILAEVDAKRVEIVELIDGPGNDPRRFRRAVETLAELVQEAPPVLVHCHAGRSRSAVVVAGYLMKARGLDPTEAVDFVDARRHVFVHDVMAALLIDLA